MRRYLLALLLFVLAVPAVAGPLKGRLASPYQWTDRPARVALEGVPAGARTLPCTLRRLPLSPNETPPAPQKLDLPVLPGPAVEIPPLPVEAIQVAGLQAGEAYGEVRFMTMAPPELDAAGFARAFPRCYRVLSSHQPFRLVTMGDSVTATGDYGEMLCAMLRRVFGYEDITCVRRAYSGRSADASVRFLQADGVETQPTLVTIMYGLNDAVCGVEKDTYAGNYEAITQVAREQAGAEVMYLGGTPDIGRSQLLGLVDPQMMLRTWDFCSALEDLGARLRVHVAPTFRAVWGTGRRDLEASARSMWGRFPTGYGSQLEPMLEGVGDTIHPGALGHLAMAKACWETLNGRQEPADPLRMEATAEWTTRTPRLSLTVTNTSLRSRQGRLQIVAPLGVKVRPRSRLYQLEPGQSATVALQFPESASAPPSGWASQRCLYEGPIILSVVDYCGETSRPYQVRAYGDPLTVWVERTWEVAAGGTVPLRAHVLNRSGQEQRAGLRVWNTAASPPAGQAIPLTIPARGEFVSAPVDVPFATTDSASRTSVIVRLSAAQGNPRATAEACAVRYGAARVPPASPVTVDGDLAEWPQTGWSVVGYPVQERGWWGPTKFRTKPSDGWLELAMAGDQEYVYLAARVQDNVVEKEGLTLFFDPRPPGVLGTCGPYFWASAELQADRKVRLGPGETTTFFEGATGAWRKTAQGWDLELRLPYRAIGCREWPAAGDLGFSLIWIDRDAEAGTDCQLYWAEDGQYWSPRWYGVVRRVDGSEASLRALPWRVRWR